MLHFLRANNTYNNHNYASRTRLNIPGRGFTSPLEIYVGLVSASACDRSSWRPSHIEEAERRGRSGAGHVEAFSCEGGVKVGSEGPTDCLWSRRDQKCLHMSNGRLRRSGRRHLHLRGGPTAPADSATQRGNSWMIPARLASNTDVDPQEAGLLLRFVSLRFLNSSPFPPWIIPGFR